MNRLHREKSPYLLQHATNPVSWFPWEPAAFELAKKEDKPIFLSIGYSTCHWCHIMAHESFEDEDVAAILNRDFVCIKVDREERPDIDAVYMAVCQMFTGSGGWPLTIFMTPDQKAFWAGTYLPKAAAYGRMGLMELLSAIKRMWDTERDKIHAQGEQIALLLNQDSGRGRGFVEPDKALVREAMKQFKNMYDRQWGGFGTAPKFPSPHNLLLLSRYSLLEEDGSSLQMVQHTLTQVFRGGIFDHLGGGFSRYSTDEKWLVPHFEKMLYDNALLTLAYLEAYQVTNDGLFQTVAERTLDYVLGELLDEKGGFYCGQDADSDGIEGKYYVFTKQEVLNVLGEEDGTAFCNWFGITEQGNFEGKSILNLLDNPHYAETDSHIQELSHRLYAYRLKRTRLHKDDKVLTSWNALMIAALAKAGWILDKSVYQEAAEKAQRFIQESLTDTNGDLKLRWREDEAAHDGQLDDYAFYAFSLLELYETTFELSYLQQAIHVSERMLDHFWDNEQGGFFLYSKHSEQLISRPKETYDGAIPSGNSVAALVLERLWKLSGDTKWRDVSQRQLRFLVGEIAEVPAGHSMALLAISQAVYPSSELVCVTAEKHIPEELLSFLRRNPLPNLTLLIKTPGNAEALGKAAPFTNDYPIPPNGITYYLCHNGTCYAPTENFSAILKHLHTGDS